MMIKFPKVYDPVLQTATFSTLLKMSRFFGDHQIIVVDSVTLETNIYLGPFVFTNDLCRFFCETIFQKVKGAYDEIFVSVTSMALLMAN